MGKLMVPLVDSKRTSGAKTESAAGRSRSRNNLQHIWLRGHHGGDNERIWVFNIDIDIDVIFNHLS